MVSVLGVLEDGQRIAVKRLSAASDQGIEELRNELELLARQEHRNLARLLGVCLGEENLLVYEYMPNGSLDRFLFGMRFEWLDSTESSRLSWELRYKIIQGIARGLQYLHEESRYTIVHRDLKASNILLDANMNPKISDFGISKLLGNDLTHASASRIAGTL
ncbi:unnamed protein product [Spirodela intermedia]|uniref:non-specific serine/threonine protein kinase n=1 Tax=Spirodela intermedia TaxID=51605 RepID=A0A7I8LGA3_SPIIN|nr:unnamed protein product [Spirodela intermedia]